MSQRLLVLIVKVACVVCWTLSMEGKTPQVNICVLCTNVELLSFQTFQFIEHAFANYLILLYIGHLLLSRRYDGM